jgi:hypothetical protein
MRMNVVDASASFLASAMRAGSSSLVVSPLESSSKSSSDESSSSIAYAWIHVSMCQASRRKSEL